LNYSKKSIYLSYVTSLSLKNREKTIAFSTSAAAFLMAIIFTVVAVTSPITIIGGDVKVASAVASTAVKVHAGGGNSTDMLSVFVPQKIQVSVGQSLI
jgi:hypothetical protein